MQGKESKKRTRCRVAFIGFWFRQEGCLLNNDMFFLILDRGCILLHLLNGRGIFIHLGWSLLLADEQRRALWGFCFVQLVSVDVRCADQTRTPTTPENWASRGLKVQTTLNCRDALICRRYCGVSGGVCRWTTTFRETKGSGNAIESICPSRQCQHR